MESQVPAPLRTRPRQTRTETRGQILDAAETLLSQRPLADLTIDELMALTGHSRTVFYRHFADLPDLVLAIAQRVGGELQAVAERWAGAAGDPLAAADEGLAALVTFFTEHGLVLKAVSVAARSDAELGRAYEALMARFVAITADALRSAEARGAIRPLAVDHTEVAIALNTMNESYLLTRLGTLPQAPADDVLAVLRTLWSRILAP